MIADLISNQEFKKLEQEYKFLSRARGESIDQLDAVILDIETTGLEPTKCEIIEIGALRIRGKEILNVYNSLVKPRAPIPEEITKLTGIDNETVKDSPYLSEVLREFQEFAGLNTLIAHNVAFDIPFIKHHCNALFGKEINNATICTLKLARHLLPNIANHKLTTVAAHFGVTAKNSHRAIGDVETAFQIWQNFIDLLKNQGIETDRDLRQLIAKLR